MSIIKNLLYKKTKTERKPKALCLFFDGKFDNELAEAADIELVGNEDLSVYKWDRNLKNKNITILNKEELERHSYDFIIFNSIITFEKHIISLPRNMHIPAVIFQHEHPGMTDFHLQQKLNTLKTSFISDIPYGLVKKDNINKDIDIIIAGMFQEADYKIVDKIKQEIPNLIVIGNNPGLSYSIPMSDYESYKEVFYRTKVYINLTTQRCMNYEALWALASGAKVVGFKLKEFDKIEKYMVNCTDIEGIISCAKRELSSYSINNKIQEEILKKFDMNNMVQFGNFIKEKYCNEVFKYE